MADPFPPLRIEVPFQGELWRVEICPPTRRNVGREVQAYAYYDKREPHSSTWVTESDPAFLKSAASMDNELMEAVARRYLREFEAILTAPSGGQYSIKREDTEPLVAQGQTERLVREIEELVLTIAVWRMIRSEEGGSLDERLREGQPAIDEWRVAEVSGTDFADEVGQFYEEYEALRAGRLLSERPVPMDTKLRRVSLLGVRALQALRPQAPRQAQRDNGHGVAWPDDRPVIITRIYIRDIRCFEEVELKLARPGDDRGQWIMLLGDNGVGKTTILRALALALLPTRTAASLVQQFMVGAPLVRSGRASGYVSIDVDHAETAITIETDGKEESLSTEQMQFHARPLVFAYGCRRGGALGGPDRTADTAVRFGVNTLFDDNASLVHAETWLRKLAHTADSLDPRERPFFEAVKKTLVGLLPGVDALVIERDHIMLEGDAVGRVPLGALSDGYLTTLGWTVDFIARYAEYARGREDYQPSGSFHQAMPCVVLIDELDLHLHPRWQTRVIGQLRRAFPLTTFVTTTHNPLTVHNSEPGEVFVVRRTPAGTIEIVRKDVPPGLHADQILTGEWFGLPSTLDTETSQLVDRHRQMLWKCVPRDDPERLDLEAKLKDRLGNFADTSSERLAQQIVADYLKGESRPITDDDRAELRKLFKRAVDEGRLGEA